MEKKAIRLVSQKPMRETEWTTPNGEKKVIASYTKGTVPFVYIIYSPDELQHYLFFRFFRRGGLPLREFFYFLRGGEFK